MTELDVLRDRLARIAALESVLEPPALIRIESL